MTTAFNAKSKALRGKMYSGNGTGKQMDGGPVGMKKLNLSQIKNQLRARSRSNRDYETYKEHSK